MQSTLSCTDEAVRPSTPLDVSMGEAAEECVAEAPATAPTLASAAPLTLASLGSALPADAAADRTHMNRTGGDTSRSSRLSTSRSEYGRQDPSKRVAGALNVDQEEVLIAIMFDDFMATNMKSLDYDRVVRNAITIQSDPDVCKVLGVVPMHVDECWIPADDCAHTAASAATRARAPSPSTHASNHLSRP